MIPVLIQYWGKLNESNAYGWRSLDRLFVPSLDTDILKKEILQRIRALPFTPHTNMVRVLVLDKNREKTRITLTDLW